MTLVEFLLARIAEDLEESEAAKRWAAEQNYPDPITGWRSTLDGGYVGEDAIVGVDPDRALAECEAKRRIVEHLIAAGRGYDWMHATEAEREADRERGLIGKLLALPYASHPDYRPDWRP